MHALGHVGHEAELESVVQFETLVFQHILTTPNGGCNYVGSRKLYGNFET